MHYRNLFVRRARWLWLAAAVLAAGLLLSVLLIKVSAATDYNVITNEEGAYQTEDGTPVFQFNKCFSDYPSSSGIYWTVKALTVDGNTYRDNAENWYYPANEAQLTITLRAEDSESNGLLVAPLQVEGAEVVSCTVEEDGTILVLTMENPGEDFYNLSVESVQVNELPDEYGVVQDQGSTMGYYYQPDGKGLGLFAHLKWVTLHSCTVPGLDWDSGPYYGIRQESDGDWTFYIIPGNLELKLVENYAYDLEASESMEVSIYSLEGETGVRAEFSDERTLRIIPDDWSLVTGISVYYLYSAMVGGSQTLVTGNEADGYVGEDGVTVYPIAQALGDWTPVVTGKIYQDAAGNYYTPQGSFDTVAFRREGLWLPTSYPETADEYPASISFAGGWTTISYTYVEVQEIADFPAAPLTAVQAKSEPAQDAVGAVQTVDDEWYFDAWGIFLPMTAFTVSVPNAPDDLGLQIAGPGQGIYSASYGQGSVTGFVVPGDLTIYLTGGYGVTDDAGISVTAAPEGVSLEVSRGDTQNAVELWFYGEVFPESVAVELTVSQAVTLTFPASQTYIVRPGESDYGVSSLVWTPGEDFPFSVEVNSGYYESYSAIAVQSCTITTSTGEQRLTLEQLGIEEAYPSWGTIPGAYLTEDCTVTFEVETDAQALVGVEPVSGPGYRAFSAYGVYPGEVAEVGGTIAALVIVEADYNQSVPTLHVPDGYTAELHLRADKNWVSVDGVDSYLGAYRNEMSRGAVVYVYNIRSDTGSFPEEGNLTVTVTGIEPNETPVDPDPPGGGGSSSGGSKEEEIRVENQLNQEGASSDTMLWPNGTKEDDGVSVTTVTDKELEALIDLAQQHIEDIKELEGDGYKEGIIVIEDLRPNSNIHTYILKLTESQFHRIAEEEWDRFTVQTPAGSMSLYGETIREVAGLKGAVDFTIARLEHGGRPGADVTLTVDGKAVTAFSEVYGIRVLVPYAPAQEEDVNALLMDYIHEDGTVERVTESFYDETAGGVYVFTDHLSKFGVAYRPAVYTDVGADHWASPYVTFLAARGLLDTGSTFRPDDKATRGELLELLAEALSAANLPSRAVQVYSDVPTSSSLARAASWAYYNNLTSSIADGGRLRPNEAITREDMAALVGNVASGVGLRLRSKGLDTGYTDLGDVASYARASVTRLRSAGILEMPDNYKFSPKATLNRGEMAQIVATLLSSL